MMILYGFGVKFAIVKRILFAVAGKFSFRGDDMRKKFGLIVQNKFPGKVYVFQNGEAVAEIGYSVLSVAVAPERNENAFLFAQKQNFHGFFDIFLSVSVGRNSHCVEFDDRSRGFRRIRERFRVYRKSRVVRMPHNINERIFRGGNEGGRIRALRAGFDCFLVQARYGLVEFFQNIRRQIDRSFRA